MIDLEEVTKIVNELNDIERKKEGQSFDERLKLLDNQGVSGKNCTLVLAALFASGVEI